MTISDLIAILMALPAGTPVAVDDGHEYRAIDRAGMEALAFVDEDEIEHDVNCLILTVAANGRSLDESLETHHRERGRP